MLDQNTDRMWYVIGAVIVGAALIFLMNGTFPTLFANVGEAFSDKTEQVVAEVDELTMTDGIGPPGQNVLKDSDTFGAAFATIRFGKDAWHSTYIGDAPRRAVFTDPSVISYSFAFKSPSNDNPEAVVYIDDVFAKSSVDYTFSFIADRVGYEPVEYEIYFGEQLIDTVVIDSSVKRVAFSGKSPVDLSQHNYIKIRSRHAYVDGKTGGNAFWMTHPKLERGRTMTPYVMQK